MSNELNTSVMISDFDLSEFEDKVMESLRERVEAMDDTEGSYLAQALEDEEFADTILDIIGETYNNETYYEKAPLQSGINRVRNNIGSAYNKYINDQEIELLDPLVGAFIGGSDWTNKDNLQDLFFMVDEGDGFVSVEKQTSFGFDTKEKSDDLVYGDWYEVNLYEQVSQKTKETYVNIYNYEKVESSGLPDLHQLMMENTLEVNDINKSHASNYEYLIVTGRIHSVVPVAIWEDDYTKPLESVLNADGTQKMDDNGKPVFRQPQKVSGYEPLAHFDKNGRSLILKVRLSDAEEPETSDGDRKNLEVGFYPQEFGIQTIHLGDEVENQVIGDGDDDPEILAELVTDFLRGKLATGLIKMTRYSTSDRNDGDGKMHWLKASGVNLFVHS